MYNDIKLLVDGKEAFPEIIKCINNAKKNIKINMFIWRDDDIGTKIAEAVLAAANRGVHIDISVDHYACILENVEECKRSFFHRKVKFLDKIQIKFLKSGYKSLYKKEDIPSKTVDLYNDIVNHKLIKLQKEKVKKDHSKYYIFDDEILILGGINIEDKENGSDISGRVYQDYMIKMSNKKYVEALKVKISENKNVSNEYCFGINYKDEEKKVFEMKHLYLEQINNATDNMIIIMPYFQDVKKVSNAIINASKRNVDITIMVPEYPNFQKDTNYKCMRKLMKKTKNKINLFFSPKMVHTKLIITENTISVGSTNIANKSLNVLSELNLFVNNVESDFKNELYDSINYNISLSRKVNDYKDIKYNYIRAFFENLFA